MEMISKVLPIAVHDDAAIAGQGICTKSYKWHNQMVIKQVEQSIL
jgi:2-oxoglutarate dehydrogenase complex dehydrogenase (E1) component-like enzyme